jgi:hypothetical protein
MGGVEKVATGMGLGKMEEFGKMGEEEGWGGL